MDSAVPALAYRMGLAMLGNYHDRVGEDYATLGGNHGDVRPSLAWGRVFGGSGSVGGAQGDAYGHFNHFMSNGPSYDFDLYGFQAGLDLYRSDDDDQRDMAGFALGAIRANSNIRAMYDGTQAGRVSLDSFTLGGYWTHIGAHGWYTDGVVQLARYDDLKARSVEGQELRGNGSGITLSLEGGYPFALGGPWMLEPQVQAVYQHVSLGGGHDDYGNISYSGGQALYGRVGLRFLHASTPQSGPLTWWTRLNLWGVTGPRPRTTFEGLDGLDPVSFRTTLGSAWWQAQLGIADQVAAKVSLFGSIDYDHSFSGMNGHGLGGRVGVRVTW